MTTTERPRPIMLGIVGDSAAGKTTITAGLVRALGAERVSVICTDDYHRYDRAQRAERGITPCTRPATTWTFSPNICACCARASRSSSRSTITAPVPLNRRSI